MKCKRVKVDPLPWKVQWAEGRGCVYIELEGDGKYLIGGETWAEFVWGDRKYFLSQIEGKAPVVFIDEYSVSVRKMNDWKTLCFSKSSSVCDIPPWAPVSLVVRGVDVPVRRGVMLALPYFS